MPEAQVKTIDPKGRLTLGQKYAGRTVQIVEEPDGVVVKMVRVVPEREAWLWENPVALALVEKGISQIRAGEVTSGPDLAEAFSFAETIPDSE